MNRIKRALASSGAVALIAGTAMVGLTATPAQASGPLTCFALEQRAIAAYNTSQYYHYLGAFNQAGGAFDAAEYYFGQERIWNVNWLNIQVC